MAWRSTARPFESPLSTPGRCRVLTRLRLFGRVHSDGRLKKGDGQMKLDLARAAPTSAFVWSVDHGHVATGRDDR
jgi:hypothetical protein